MFYSEGKSQPTYILSLLKMIAFDDATGENIREHNLNWPDIPERQYRMLIIAGSGSGKTNVLHNLIDHQPDTDEIYLYVKVHQKQNTSS